MPPKTFSLKYGIDVMVNLYFMISIIAGVGAVVIFTASSYLAEPDIGISGGCTGTARCITGTVTRIVDGDTIWVDNQSVRFALASAPEISDDRGIVAREVISELCPVGSRVLVDEDDLQREGSHGRVLGVIYCNGMNLNEEILKSGFGYVLTEFCGTSEFGYAGWAQRHGC